jgi:hypothetical protein
MKFSGVRRTAIGLADYWRRKHDCVAYVPSMLRRAGDGGREYRFGDRVRLGEETDFLRLLQAVERGLV